MFNKRSWLAAAMLGGALFGCTDDAGKIRGVQVTEDWKVEGLTDRVEVVRTEGNVPHIYGKTRADVARVTGFVFARDRFFMMDLARRLGLGQITELLGEPGLQTDQQSRETGMTWVADEMTAHLNEELAEHVDAFAAGVNDYIARVQNEELEAPTELKIASGLLGSANPAGLMKPFARRDVMAIVAVTLYQSSFEPGDVGRAQAAARLSTAFVGATDEALRRAGLAELWLPTKPVYPRTSAPGFGLSTGARGVVSADASKTSGLSVVNAVGARIPDAVLSRLSTRLGKMQIRIRRDKDAGYGSNAWAVAGYASADGASLLAGDGHLSLAVPSVLFQFGVDTELFGKGGLHQLGLTIPGFPVMAIGTNGDVAWSQTQVSEDITDWYREEIQLGADGYPAATKWMGEWKPVVRVDEKYLIANIPALNSMGRTETWSRWTTFDGRWLADVEGRDVTATEALAPGEVRVNMQGAYVVPGDLDMDGVVTGVSFDYAGLDAGQVIIATDQLGRQADVERFRQATRGLVGYSQNFTVGDSKGNILYTSYQAVPCRKYLPRNTDGSFVAGADPALLLDGTKYGAFRIPISSDHHVDETFGATDPYSCVIPFDRIPQSINPDEGYVATANNDPSGVSLDGSLTNDEWYLGGPWDKGFRMETISRTLENEIAEKRATVASMATLQGNFESRLGELFVDSLLGAIDKGRAGTDARAQAVYAANQVGFGEVYERLTGWKTRGFMAHSGVETFYNKPTDVEREDAVATMIFNAWLGPAISKVLDDENEPGIIGSDGSHGRVGIFKRLLDGRGAGNPGALMSFNIATGESVYFDVLGTPEVETSDEDLLVALADALTFLRSAPTKPGVGGFGTGEMSEWIWGMRHQVKFESLLADFLGDDPMFAFLTEQLQIDTNVIPLVPGIDSTDPRAGLKWFPRHGDQYGVDAANPGLSGRTFTHGSGAVMRMVVSLKNGAVQGKNIIPGGQSAITDSDHFADQAKLWLANETYPLRFHPSDVADGAIGHEVYRP